MFQEQTCENKDGCSFELHQEETLDISIIQNVDVAILDKNGKGDKHIASIYFKNDLETEDIAHEQLEVKYESCLSPFAHQQGIHIHVLQDHFTNLLKSSVKEKKNCSST